MFRTSRKRKRKRLTTWDCTSWEATNCCSVVVDEASLVGGDVKAMGGSVGYAVTGAGLIGAGLIGASEIGALLTGESVGESVLSTGDNVVGAELLLTTSVSSSSIKFNGSVVGYIYWFIAMRIKC